MVEISVCRIWKDDDGGLNDEVLETDDSPDYEFFCKCERDCTHDLEVMA
jgi:hypothetical protein